MRIGWSQTQERVAQLHNLFFGGRTERQYQGHKVRRKSLILMFLIYKKQGLPGIPGIPGS